MNEFRKDKPVLISVSVVSHEQTQLVDRLLQDILEHCRNQSLQLILTLNVDEPLPPALEGFAFPVHVIQNETPKGFAVNQDQAFSNAVGRYFCVMNPDIRLIDDPFPALIACLQNPSIGVSAPVVLGEDGTMEDSARRFPTPLKILCKALGGCRGSDYPVKDKVVFPDWVAGMFMLFRREIFEESGGFDERYFLYYEDVDLCARLRLLGYEVALCPDAKVIHHARRSSHRNLKYLTWLMASMLRFFFSALFLKICWMKWTKRS